MLYLNDQIFIDIPVVNSSYINYTISSIAPYWFTQPTAKTLFTGRAYAYKDDQQIYLNDVLSSYADNYSWMSYEKVRKFLNNRQYNSLMDVLPEQQDMVFSNIRTSFDQSTSKYINVGLFYLDKRLEVKPSIGFINWFANTTTPQSFNTLSQRTTILPRIPKISQDNTDFFIGGLFGTNAAWRNYSELDGDGVFRVVLLDKDENILPAERDYSYNIYDHNSPMTSVLISGYLTTGMSPGGFDIHAEPYKYVAIAPAHSENDAVDDTDITAKVILAEYDDCNADYYLIWCDRTGGYQCQPFCKKTTMKENINTTTLTDIYGESRPMLKSVTNTWELNSDWLTYEQYKAYETIFTSPYMYLYDTQYNELTPVFCTDKNWTEKTKNNNKKPFNLKLTVSSSRDQNILY